MPRRSEIVIQIETDPAYHYCEPGRQKRVTESQIEYALEQ